MRRLMKSLTVYCASSTHLDPDFHAPATLVGAELARRGITLVYGGGCVGLMGEIARAARAQGGRLIGLMNKRVMEHAVADSACDEVGVGNREAGLQGATSRRSILRRVACKPLAVRSRTLDLGDREARRHRVL